MMFSDKSGPRDFFNDCAKVERRAQGVGSCGGFPAEVVSRGPDRIHNEERSRDEGVDTITADIREVGLQEATETGTGRQETES